MALVAAVQIPSYAQSEEKTIETFPDYPYVLIMPEGQPLEMNDSLFFKYSRGVRFKVNKTELTPSDKFFTDFRRLLPKLWDSDIQLRGAYIRGGASPEGPYNNNVRLARERAAVLESEIKAIAHDSHFTLPLMTSASTSEDYTYLLALMRAANDPDYATVENVCNKWKDNRDECQRTLKGIRGGALWARLLKDYFPRIRRSNIIIWGWHHDNHRLPMPERPKERVEAGMPNIHVEVPVMQQEEAPLPRKRMLALRTNLIHDFLWLPNLGWALTPNLQAEYFPLRGHLTLNGDFSYSQLRHWGRSKFYQMRDARLELRRYFRGGGTFEGLYLGAYGEYTKYGIGFNKEKGWEGEGGGGGLSLGHTLRLNHKGSLRLEFSLSVGYFYTQYDPYVYGNPKTGVEDGKYYYNYTGLRRDFKRRNHYRTWVGPTNAGIHITYDILYHKRGAGMKKGGNQ